MHLHSLSLEDYLLFALRTSEIRLKYIGIPGLPFFFFLFLSPSFRLVYFCDKYYLTSYPWVAETGMLP